MFNYKIYLKFKDEDNLLKQEINVLNPGQEGVRPIFITKISILKSGILIFISSIEKISNFSSIAEMITRLKNFMIAVLDISILNNENAYTEEIYLQEGGQWNKVVFEFTSNIIFVDYKRRATTEDCQHLVNYMYGDEDLPLSYILLKKSKNIEDRRQQFISIMTACEIGVKEFYKETKPDLAIILDNLQSPPITKLLGSIFTKYFQNEFPKELRKQIQQYVERRNSFIHSSQKNVPSLEECIKCYTTVLKTLNYLSKMGGDFLYNHIYDEELTLIQLDKNMSKFECSDLIKQKITSGELIVNAKINVSHDYNTPNDE